MILAADCIPDVEIPHDRASNPLLLQYFMQIYQVDHGPKPPFYGTQRDLLFVEWEFKMLIEFHFFAFYGHLSNSANYQHFFEKHVWIGRNEEIIFSREQQKMDDVAAF